MAPELVIATAPSVTYPGGVVAVRAADWIASGSSTASSESNALASTGQVVRETQQVVPLGPPYLEPEDYEVANDTLVIPAADIGLEDDFDYEIWLSVFLEGERDLTNGDLLNQCSNTRWDQVALGGVHGTTFQPEDNPYWETRTLANVPHFWPFLMELFFVQADDDVLRFRFFTQDGTTAEWLIDQLIFVPFGGTDSWQNPDFESVGADVPLIPTTIGGPVDGADSGDANGKFTYSVGHDVDSSPPGTDYSDYQQKSDGDDAEYDQAISGAESGVELYNSVTAAEAEADGYSYHYVRCREEITFMEDTFDNRTTGPGVGVVDMGISPDGYGYQVGQTSGVGVAYVDGTKGVLNLPNGISQLGLWVGSSSTASNFGGLPEFNQGSVLWGTDQWEFRAILEWASADAGLDFGLLRFFVYEAGSSNHRIIFDLIAGTWEYEYVSLGTVEGPHSSGGVVAVGETFGVRIEAKRFVFRFRFWDASGAEPSTWDYEEFFLLNGTAYPYGDVESVANLVTRRKHLFFDFIGDSFGAGPFAPTVFYVHNVQMLHNPYGDPADGVVRYERPEGTSLGDMTIPWGCPYMVYWGREDWTEDNAGDFDLEYASRWWNDPGAAELQRLVTSFSWFRSVHPGEIMSMNWSSAKNFDVRRVHG